jgi:glyceraldehyde 3-phosphate dehydrogenase
MKVAINGFGRIGRLALRIAMSRPDITVVAVNDPSSTETLAHLLKYDSSYGIFDKPITVKKNSIVVGSQEIATSMDREPLNLPWNKLGVDVVIECTGAFTNREGAGKHIKAGAKRVIISAPAKDEIDGTFVMGVNNKNFDPKKDFIVSNASCTTNCLAPVAKVLNDSFGIESGLMTTIHAYTNDQVILDASHKDLRRARSAALNMIPTTTGAAKAVGLVIPELKGKLNGFAIRVPTPTVSIVDLTCVLKKKVQVETVNAAFKDASQKSLKGFLGYTEEPLVSTDFKQSHYSAIVDGLSTFVINDTLCKVLAWYDNEWGYTERMVDLCEHIGKECKY